MAPETVREMLVDVDAAFKEIADTTERELDFRNEGQALVKFRKLNEDVEAVSAPKPYLPYTSKRVIVMEFVDGVRSLNLHQIREAGYVKEDLAKKLVYSFLKQIFKDGFFHGDPHPGNMIIRDKKIVLVDFGIVGELSQPVRDDL